MLAALLAAAVIAAPAAYKIDPGASEAGFDLKATGHTVHGLTHGVAGSVRAELIKGDDALALSGRIEIDAASIRTGNDRRDATLHEKTLLVASFPSLIFEPERFAPSGPPSPDGSVAGSLTGRFTMRGKTKPITIAATLTPKGERMVASGTFDVAWADYGCPDPSFFVIHIADVAHAHFRAELVREP